MYDDDAYGVDAGVETGELSTCCGFQGAAEGAHSCAASANAATVAAADAALASLSMKW